MSKHLQIGEVAKRTELSINTIRHYDEAGLVTPSARSAGGFRLYTDADIDRLLVIRRMKPLGFTLEEMGELLAAIDDPSSTDLVAAFHERAQKSCDKLRTQLAYAEELTALLASRIV
ncbi:MerR family transcriptional regulator [Actinomycetes bacterium M1A6_2h]